MKDFRSPWEAYSVAVEILAAGQPRPYADSRWEARLTLSSSSDPDFKFDRISEEVVRRIAYGLVREYSNKPKEKREWYESYLDVARQEKPGVWFVRIVQPYTD